MLSLSRRACILVPEHLLEPTGLTSRPASATSMLISAAPLDTAVLFARAAIGVEDVAGGFARGSDMTGRRSASACEWCKAGGR